MIPEEILTYYRSENEQERLGRSLGVLEFARSREVIGPLLPNAPATIYDVGGGTGPYARWLVQKGYEVHLLDAAPHHVEKAQEIPGLGSAVVGDARSLPFADETADAVLLQGPLYHLTEREGRLKTLREVRRVLRPGGRVFAAGISRAAYALYGLHQGWLFDEDFLPFIRERISTGIHKTPPTRPDLFTTSYYHRPEELAEEVREAGFELEGLVGLEGPGWTVPDFKTVVIEPDERERLLELARALASIPDLSPHILAWGVKRG